MRGGGPRKGPTRWQIFGGALAVGGAVLFLGANAHLLTIAIATDPECVKAAPPSPENAGYAAARPAC